jgi:hypothetical protein
MHHLLPSLFLFMFMLSQTAVGQDPSTESQQSEPMTIRPIETKHQHHRMHIDMDGMVMNENSEMLPEGCERIAGEAEITVHAGHKLAQRFSGKIFAFDQQEWDIDPCTRLKVTLVNDDDIRHQLMIHELPVYLHPPFGMFTIEVNGKGRKTGTLITPKEKKTYLVHCDVPQHMENGMKAQLKVAGGDGDLSSIPGLTAEETPDHYPVEWSNQAYVLLCIAAFTGITIPFLLRGRFRNRGSASPTDRQKR